MPNSTYQSTLDWLYAQFPSYQLIGSKAYKPTLENIQKICDQLGNPEKELRFIHIAGTNGKGSSSSMLASILTESGEKTGLFTSPHILDFRERIRINGDMIPESDVVNFVEKIKEMDLSFDPSFFEVTFAMALDHFKRSDCTICVIETGLGGRLDATNIITPLISLITNISLEHTAILGNTISEIAGEKAGIIKPNVPVVIGETVAETKKVFLNKATEQLSQIHFADSEISEKEIEKYSLPFQGSYQKKNLKSVLCALKVLNEKFPKIDHSKIQSGLNNLSQNTGFFGRMQVVSKEPLIIFDVSHNLEGIVETLRSLNMTSDELYLLYGSSSDKDVSSILKCFPESSKVYLTAFKSERSLNIEQLNKLKKEFKQPAFVFSDPKNALEEIQKIAKKEDTILVFGSFFLLSDLLKK